MPSKNYLVVVSDDFKNVRYCVRQFVIFASNNIVMPVQFSLDTRVRQSGEQAIRLSWSYGVHRYQTTIGFSVKKAHWDARKRRVVLGTHNANGVYAEAINTYLNKLYGVSVTLDRAAKERRIILTRAIMQGAFSDALSNNYAGTQVIADKWVSHHLLQGQVLGRKKRTTASTDSKLTIVQPQPVTYYRFHKGGYYRRVCKAYYETLKTDLIILQELFGFNRFIAVTPSDFRISHTNEGELFAYYMEVSEAEALGRG